MNYREVAIAKALRNKSIALILTDGPIAEKEMKRVLTKLGEKDIPVVNIARTDMSPAAGIIKAGHLAKKIVSASGGISGKMADIPRSHLPWWSRTWEGTSGDRVFDAQGKHRGGVRALVTPDWVANQKIVPLQSVEKSIAKIKAELEKDGIRLGSEPIQHYLQRKCPNELPMCSGF
jgi:hypothetical protein